MVSRFFWPPLIPLVSWLPTSVSAHTCSHTQGMDTNENPHPGADLGFD